VREAFVIAFFNAIVGPLLGTLVDDRLGTRTRLLTHVRQSRQLTQPASVGNRATTK